MKNIIIAACITVLAAASGCASSSFVYGPDGRPAHSINCSGAFLNWGECFKKAGSLCGSNGYDTLAVNGQNVGTIVSGNPTSGVFATPVVERIMMVACNIPGSPSR